MNCYSGTSTRWGQKCAVSISVQNKWDLISLDTKCAFLQGITFEEVESMTNAEETVVHLDLKSVESLRITVLRKLMQARRYT